MFVFVFGWLIEIYIFSGKDEGIDEGFILKCIIISDFRGVLVCIDVVKKKGMENEWILDIEGDEDCIKVKVFSVLLYYYYIC